LQSVAENASNVTEIKNPVTNNDNEFENLTSVEQSQKQILK